MRRMIGASVLAAAVVAIGLAQGTPTPAGTLAGTIDVHVHSYPDDRPRSIHAIDVAKLAIQILGEEPECVVATQTGAVRHCDSVVLAI